MRILHISDLHVTNHADHARTINALCDDIITANKAKKIDAILCTGDIASRGDTSKAAIIAQEAVIRKILNSTSPETEFLCCPGNHDVNLKDREEIYESIFFTIKSPEDANRLIESLVVKGNVAIWGHLNGYIELSKKIDPLAYKENILFTTKKNKNRICSSWSGIPKQYLAHVWRGKQR